jgi:hypothetical protein
MIFWLKSLILHTNTFSIDNFKDLEFFFHNSTTIKYFNDMIFQKYINLT